MSTTNILQGSVEIAGKNTETQKEILETKEAVNSILTQDISELFAKQFPGAKEYPVRQILTGEKSIPVQVYHQDIYEHGMFGIPSVEPTHFVTVTVASDSQYSNRIDFPQLRSDFETMLIENRKEALDQMREKERDLNNQGKDIISTFLKQNNIEKEVMEKYLYESKISDYSFHPTHFEINEKRFPIKESTSVKLFMEQREGLLKQYELLIKEYRSLDHFLQNIYIELRSFLTGASERKVIERIEDVIVNISHNNTLQEKLFKNHSIIQVYRSYIKKMEQIGFHTFDHIKGEVILGSKANAMIKMEDVNNRFISLLHACEHERGYDLSTVYLNFTRGDGRFSGDTKEYLPTPGGEGDYTHIIPQLLKKIQTENIKNVIYIPQIEVHPEYQGKGYSKALLDGITWFVEHGKYQADATYAIIENSNPQKDRMMATFKKAGYEIFQFWKEHLPGDSKGGAYLAFRIHPKKI